MSGISLLGIIVDSEALVRIKERSPRKKAKNMRQEIWKSSCWGCLRAKNDPKEKYVCLKVQQHWKDWEKEQSKYF